MTRAFARLIQGDVSGAFAFHPLVLVVAALAGGSLVWYVGRRKRGWPPLSTRAFNLGGAVLGATFLAVWVLRFATNSLPAV
jgi:hypothetical protein